MLYRSTRGGEAGVSFEAATLAGYAADGGLYVPEQIPTVSSETLRRWRGLSFQALSVEVLSLFVGECIGAAELRGVVERSFERFTEADVVPVVEVGGLHIAELFHGPTLAFKDFGQQVLCKLLDFFATRAGRPTTLVVSTTGDTGPACIHGALGSASLRVVVTYPQGQISEIQRRQMTTVDAPNVAVAAFQGSGDDMDAPIKRISSDSAFREAFGVTSVNSINIGRVTVQTIHYFWAYLRAIEQLEGGGGGFGFGDALHFAIPTGAMGNVTAGALAQRMGCPIAQLCCGVNANNILHRAVTSGEFHKRPMVRTLSEAINIGVPYNFERILYFLTGGDCGAVAAMMAEVDGSDALTIEGPLLASLQELLVTTTVDDEAMAATTRAYWDAHAYLLDPHSAVCVAAAEALAGEHKCVCLATAHPCKFEESLQAAEMGEGFWRGATSLAETEHMPPSAAALRGLPEVGKPDFLALDGGRAPLEESQAAWERQLRGMVAEMARDGSARL